MAGGQILAFPIDFDYRPYNTTVRVCDHRRIVIITLHYKNKNWLQFLFIVKAAVLKQQISKCYPEIQRTEASDHIYFSQRHFINVKAIFCVEFADKILIFAVLGRRLLQ